MRGFAVVLVLAGLGVSLSGCAVVSVGSAVGDAGVTVASTAVDVTTDVAGAAVDTVSGSGKKDKN